MNYKNQLVLTGEINDVGAPIMVNVDKSYRTGIELMAAVKITGGLQWKGNTTISENKIMDFTEFVDNWDTWTQESFYLGKTFLAFAPGFTGNSQFIYSPVKNLDLILISSYVGKQYIDNTSNSDRLLHSWFVNSINASYTIKPGFFKSITFRLLVNNLFDEKYESNAWVYSYISEGKRLKMDGYFPQAGTNFMIGADFKF